MARQDYLQHNFSALWKSCLKAEIDKNPEGMSDPRCRQNLRVLNSCAHCPRSGQCNLPEAKTARVNLAKASSKFWTELHKLAVRELKKAKQAEKAVNVWNSQHKT